MSFILDALKKSDHRRQTGQGPDLTTTAAGQSQTSRRRRRGPGLGLALASLALLAIAAVVYLQREPLKQQWQAWTASESSIPASPEPQPPAAASSEAPRAGASVDSIDPESMAQRPVPGTPRERVVTDPEEAQARLERLAAARERSRQLVAERAARNAANALDGDDSSTETLPDPAANAARRQAVPTPSGTSVVAQAPERPNVTAPDAAEAERIQRRLLEATQRREQAMQERAIGDDKAPPEGVEVAAETPRTPAEIRPMPTGEATLAPPESDAPWSPEAAEYVHAWELPLSIRRNMPALVLNIHVFAEQPEDRFVLINGERFVSGDELPDGARLVDIRREGAIVDFRDYRFLLEP